MIIAQAKRHGVPEKLVRRVVMRESRYNPRARNHSFWGLMQISYPTAKSMGFKGSPQDLLNPLVNLTYAVPYLANAFVIAGQQEDAAVRLYASGYYDTARSRGLLNALRTANSDPVRGSGLPRDQPPIISTAYETTPTTVVPVAIVATAPATSMVSDGGVAMVADKHGDMGPPKKWLHDGGTTTIARGEQRIEQVAAYAKANGAADETERSHTARAHAHKTIAFASLDTPGEAQAYAAAPAPDARLAQTDSQAAISQATSGRPTDAPVADEAVAPTRRKHSVRRHATPSDGATKVAKADEKPTDATPVEDGPAKDSRKKHAAAHKKAQAVALRQQADEPAPAPPRPQ